jgi:dolichol-phosphate mannosyltransferase
MFAKHRRQASLRITLTAMTVMVRPAVSVGAPCFGEEYVLPPRSWVGGVPDSLGGTSELVLVDDVGDSRVVGVPL